MSDNNQEIQSSPEVRDRIGEAIMTSIICTHEFTGAICETCWESTQRIGKALVVLRTSPDSGLAAVLTEHRYLCGSDRGVSPRWEQCACGERFTTFGATPAWRLLAEHQVRSLRAVLPSIDGEAR